MKNKKPTILVLVGAPGSGKSTYAKYHLRTEENWSRVSRDDFRAMHYEGAKASDDTEKKITVAIDACLKAYLQKGISVLIDATNCKKDYINTYVKNYGNLANIKFKVFDVPLDELKERCVKREAATGKHIPTAVLEKFVSELNHLKKTFDFEPILYKPTTFEPAVQIEGKPNVFLCDLDGTIAKANGRSMFNPTAADIMKDTPIVPAIKVLQSLAAQYKIIFVSGRDDNSFEATKQWIEKHVFNTLGNDQLLMRKAGDSRRDSIVKKEILREQILPLYNVIAVFDDRLQVIRECWNEEGVFCFNVNQLLEAF